jgi:predicted HAD superfamily Cof-like phosphohydrolase
MEQQQVVLNEQQLVAQFIKAFKGSLDLRLWVNLMKEELAEYNAAFKTNDREEMLKEIADVLYVKTGFLLVLGGGVGEDIISREEEQEWMNILDETHKAYLQAEAIFSTATIWEAFKRVHTSNMSKLGDDGKPVLREDGKILKGPNYKKPYLTDLLEVGNIT